MKTRPAAPPRPVAAPKGPRRVITTRRKNPVDDGLVEEAPTESSPPFDMDQALVDLQNEFLSEEEVNEIVSSASNEAERQRWDDPTFVEDNYELRIDDNDIDDERPAREAVRPYNELAWRVRYAAAMHPAMNVASLMELTYTVPSWRNPMLPFRLLEGAVNGLDLDNTGKEQEREFALLLLVDPMYDGEDWSAVREWAQDFLDNEEQYTTRRSGLLTAMNLDMGGILTSATDLAAWWRLLPESARNEALLPADMAERLVNSGWRRRLQLAFKQYLPDLVVAHPDDHELLAYLLADGSHGTSGRARVERTANLLLEQDPSLPTPIDREFVARQRRLLAHPDAKKAIRRAQFNPETRHELVLSALWYERTHPDVRREAEQQWADVMAVVASQSRRRELAYQDVLELPASLQQAVIALVVPRDHTEPSLLARVLLDAVAIEQTVIDKRVERDARAVASWIDHVAPLAYLGPDEQAVMRDVHRALIHQALSRYES